MKTEVDFSTSPDLAGVTVSGMPSSSAAAAVEHAIDAGTIITAALKHRPCRGPALAAENAALVSLARALTGPEDALLMLLSETALTLCAADSSGKIPS
ncbi:hypothetical protein [Caballeronia sordidicola]|uniref:hypothetical protein n=1 Tax=Caballeronia sordidicola TaxID=196367 RepID=UPI000B78EBF3|nr:hypothetical protein [Caballeronia sordidicola]